MSSKIKLEIVSAEASLLSEQVTSVIVSGEAGELGIFPGHLQLLTRLKPGQVRAQLANKEEELKKRSWQILVTLQNATNRAKMISSTECALFVHTEQQHWTSHNEAPMFVSRPIYMASECQRLMLGSKHTLIKPTTTIHFSIVGFCHVPPPCKTNTPTNAPGGIPNIGNTCFMNTVSDTQGPRASAIACRLPRRPPSCDCAFRLRLQCLNACLPFSDDLLAMKDLDGLAGTLCGVFQGIRGGRHPPRCEAPTRGQVAPSALRSSPPE